MVCGEWHAERPCGVEPWRRVRHERDRRDLKSNATRTDKFLRDSRGGLAGRFSIDRNKVRGPLPLKIRGERRLVVNDPVKDPCKSA